MCVYSIYIYMSAMYPYDMVATFANVDVLSSTKSRIAEPLCSQGWKSRGKRTRRCRIFHRDV